MLIITQVNTEKLIVARANKPPGRLPVSHMNTELLHHYIACSNC